MVRYCQPYKFAEGRAPDLVPNNEKWNEKSSCYYIQGNLVHGMLVHGCSVSGSLAYISLVWRSLVSWCLVSGSWVDECSVSGCLVNAISVYEHSVYESSSSSSLFSCHFPCMLVNPHWVVGLHGVCVCVKKTKNKNARTDLNRTY